MHMHAYLPNTKRIWMHTYVFSRTRLRTFVSTFLLTCMRLEKLFTYVGEVLRIAARFANRLNHIQVVFQNLKTLFVVYIVCVGNRLDPCRFSTENVLFPDLRGHACTIPAFHSACLCMCICLSVCLCMYVRMYVWTCVYQPCCTPVFFSNQCSRACMQTCADMLSNTVMRACLRGCVM